MVPFPDADVLSGGTCWSPDRLTFKPSALAAMAIVHPSAIKSVAADAGTKTLDSLTKRVHLISSLFWPCQLELDGSNLQ
jgi:hypothetical protein